VAGRIREGFVQVTHSSTTDAAPEGFGTVLTEDRVPDATPGLIAPRAGDVAIAALRAGYLAHAERVDALLHGLRRLV
jgi:hypothetical protein